MTSKYLKWKEYLVVSNNSVTVLLNRGTKVQILEDKGNISKIKHLAGEFYVANKALTKYKILAYLDRVNDRRREAKYNKLLNNLRR